MVIDVSIENPRHLAEILETPGIQRVMLAGDRYDAAGWNRVCEEIHRAGKQAIYAFPYVLRREALQYYQKNREYMAEAGWDGFLIRSLDAAGLVQEEAWEGIRIFDQGMYTWNRRAVQQMRALGADLMTLPYELRQSEMDLRGYEDSQLVVYGRLPVMISAQCSRKTTGHCRLLQGKKREQASCEAEFIALRDRKSAAFREDSHCRFCYSVIYNSVPLWLVDRIPEACSQVRFAFTDEPVGVPSRILKESLRLNSEGIWEIYGHPSADDFTRGHFMRGVE